MSQIQLTSEVLKNGLRLLTVNLKGFSSITNFLAIRSGSRYETLENNGIAHFLEHMVFKGTEKYPETVSIAEAIEGSGGYFNAWTANDHTCYWNTVPKSSWEKGIEVPFELAFRALLRPEDLEREKGVIIEEIRRMQDDPSSLVNDYFGQVLFPNHPLGYSIIGSEERIKSMTIEHFRDYRDSHYRPSQAIFICMGDLENVDVKKAVEKLTNDLSSKPISKPQKYLQVSQKNLSFHSKKTDQTHFILGVADPILAPDGGNEAVAEVLNAVLGRGMSSRLFLNIREKKGLAYSIHSDYHTFEDIGLVQIYGGVNTDKIALTLEALDEELLKLSTDLVGDRELTKAKTYVAGSYDMKADRPIDIARWYGVGRLLGDEQTFDEAKAKVLAVTAEEVQSLASKIFQKDRRVLAVIGPQKNDAVFRKFLKV